MREKYLTPKEASERYGVTTESLRNWEKQGKIRAAKLPNGDRRYEEATLRRFLHLPSKTFLTPF